MEREKPEGVAGVRWEEGGDRYISRQQGGNRCMNFTCSRIIKITNRYSWRGKGRELF